MEFEDSVDLRVIGIPNDVTYKDEQYVQRIAEQVQILVNTKRILKEDPLGDNILSEKAAKKNFAGNCELHEIQKSTDKVQFQRCCSYVEAGFQVCHCGGKLNMSEEMLSCKQQKIQATHRRRLHDIPENVWGKAWCSSVAIASFPSQSIYLKIQWKRAYIRRLLTASRMIRNFTQAGQNITIGQKNGLRYLTSGGQHRGGPTHGERNQV